MTGALEDATFTIPKASLFNNDSDVDNTNGELTLSWVGSATGGTVAINASGDVVFGFGRASSANVVDAD